jgi:hypothetical protein
MNADPIVPEDPIIKARKGFGTRGIDKEVQVSSESGLS